MPLRASRPTVERVLFLRRSLYMLLRVNKPRDDVRNDVRNDVRIVAGPERKTLRERRDSSLEHNYGYCYAAVRRRSPLHRGRRDRWVWFRPIISREDGMRLERSVAHGLGGLDHWEGVRSHARQQFRQWTDSCCSSVPRSLN